MRTSLRTKLIGGIITGTALIGVTAGPAMAGPAAMPTRAVPAATEASSLVRIEVRMDSLLSLPMTAVTGRVPTHRSMAITDGCRN